MSFGMDVLIKVGSAGVNNTDLNTRLGWYSKSSSDSDDESCSKMQYSLLASEVIKNGKKKEKRQ